MILLTQLIFLQSFAWTVLPSLKDTFEQFQWSLWLLNILLVAFIFYRFSKSIWRSRSGKTKIEIAASLSLLIGGLALAALILFVLFGAITLKHFTGFYCSEDFEAVEFPRYEKTVYLMTTGCRDGIIAGGRIYIHKEGIPLMKEIFEINEGYFDRSTLIQDGDLLEISSITVEPTERSDSKVLIYNLKTGNIKTTHKRKR
ncbi:MAG: hypothetical protein AAF215_18320 [Cyanobacteria bacterium P01_A01_bin.123]